MGSETAKEGSPAGLLRHRADSDAIYPQDGTNNVEDANAPEYGSGNASSVHSIVVNEKPNAVSRKQKLKQHLRRFWWCYLIALIVLLVILLPILFKVIIPAIINNLVSDQKLPVNGGALRVLSPTQVSMTLNTSLDTPLGVTIEPTNLDLCDAQGSATSPFLTLRMPEQHVYHNTEVIIPTQTVPIANQTQLIEWFNEFFDKPQAKLSVVAGLNIHLGKLDYNSDLDKTIEVAGLDSLNGFSLQDVQFMLSIEGTGHNMKGHLNIPNPGVLTLGLGNLTFNLMSGNINLGMVNIYNLDLKPGNNTLPFDGVFFFDTLVPNLAAILSNQKEALSQGNIAFNATGNSTVVAGEHIEYIEGVLNQKHLPFSIPVTTLLGDVLSGLLPGSNPPSQSSLLDILGDVVGNSTLFGQLLDNWKGKSKSGNGNRKSITGALSTMKRAKL